MKFRKFCAALLGIVMICTAQIHGIQSVSATQLEIIQTEPSQAEPTIISSTQPQESEPGVTIEPTAPMPSETEPDVGLLLPAILIQAQEEAIPESTDPRQLQQDPSEPVLFSAAQAEAAGDASQQDDDLETVSGQGISFRLFNYSTEINKSSGSVTWRPISMYFTFRSSLIENGEDPTAYQIPSPASNAEHDQDGFTKSHATVERLLDGAYPVLDLTRNADGTLRTDPGIEKSVRSLSYLFSSGDHAVTAYTPVNTILRQSGSHYWYNSAEHAVDYDIAANRFRLRSYPERNSVTAGYGTAYGDFLPFTYTGGEVLDTTADGAAYHVTTEATDYWFGMTMEVSFFQTKGGKLGDQNMVFSFSGDDDVWVFVDDVLLLDLGGTHGTVNGTINFATGEILQYLSWKGANATEAERSGGSATSFPTTIRDCFDAAGKKPNGGWSVDGNTFADFTEHTLKFYYLERGAAVANCSLDFRLPTLPDESLTVTKDLTTAQDSGLRDYLAEGVSYAFRVMKADSAGNGTSEPFITSGMSFDLLENGSKVGSGTVGEDHCFYLKAGQSAQFTQMLRKGNGSTTYVVEEIMPDELSGQYDGVEYLLSGAGGNTVTEDQPAESFTAFRTKVLSAEETQTVTFQNRVDTRRLGTLKITKQAAPGTQIPQDLFFKMQVKLDGTPLPVGATYLVSGERRKVETEGELFLRAGETAVIEQGILAGTAYQITELSASLDGYRPAYTGTAEPSGTIFCTQDGASGVFALEGSVHITVTNADYDFAVQLPIRKKVLDFQQTDTFSFLIEQVTESETGWEVLKILPEAQITVTSDQTAESLLTIGYPLEAEGIFYYRITEKNGSGSYRYDDRVFLVEVTVSDGAAQVSRISCNGSETDQVLFENRAVTSLTVTKTVAGGNGSEKFPFTAEVLLNGDPYLLPESEENSGYTVSGNVLSFSLGDGESMTLSCIPIDAVVTVKETGFDGFLVLHKLENVDDLPITSSIREIQFTNVAQTIHFTNQSGFRMPHTGGSGTASYVSSGSALACLSAALLLKDIRKCKGKLKSYFGKDRNHENNA